MFCFLKFLNKNFKKDEPLILRKKDSLNNILRKYIHRYKYMLNEANIIISKDSRVELSHHKGVKNLE